MENILSTRRRVSDQPLSVTQITNQLRDLIEREFADVVVEGEISGWMEAASGHCYFTLKDAGAILSSVMWRTSRQRLRFRPADGMKVVCRGRLTLYDKRGQYQLVAESMTQGGEGDLWARFQRLKARLEDEGLFDPARKRPIPSFPQRIGIVTSPTGAVIRDILTTLRRRAPAISAVIYPARVQGAGAALELAQGVRALSRTSGIDLIIVARGGGSMEDLWEFNDEGLARAVVASPIPVISAVGHETDFSICDFAADVRAATPSIAAELVSNGYTDLRQRIGTGLHRIDTTMRNRVRDQRRHLQGLLGSYALRRPESRLRELAQRVDDLTARLPRLMERRAERIRSRIERATAAIQAQDPALIQKRGYAIIRRAEDGAVVTRAAAVQAEELLRIQFSDAECKARTLGDQASSEVPR